MKYKLLVLCFILFNTIYKAQNIMDIPPLDGSGKPAFVNIINGDTVSGGKRANLNRIYRLQRDGIYIVSSTLKVDFPLRLIAADGTGRPPMLVRGKSVTGANIRPMIRFTSDNVKHSFKDVIIQGVDLERKYYKEWFWAFEFQGDKTNVTFDKVVFNAFTAGAANFSGKNNSIFFSDCVWRNGVWPNHPFVGQQHNFGEGGIDTLIVTNSTYFNNNSYLLYTASSVAKYFVFEHNTIFTSIVDAIHLKAINKGNIRSNIFYGYAAYGDSKTAQVNSWYESDASKLSIISTERLPATSGLTEAARILKVTNNSYFTPKPIKDYYLAFDSVKGPLWMNDRTLNMFNDKTTWPGFQQNANLEIDPLFEDKNMNDWVVGEVVKFCTENRQTSTAGWGTASGYRNYDEHLGKDILTDIQWPLPEKMKITAASLLTAGHDGLPVGDLNWDPALRSRYKLSPITDIENDINILPTQFVLYQNYPNPFNPNTRITYKIAKPVNVSISIFNILGQKITTLVNQFQLPGEFQVDWNGKDNSGNSVSNGIYIYQIKAGDFLASKKMTLLK